VTGESGAYYDVQIASSALYAQFTGSSYVVFGEDEPTSGVLSGPATFDEAANEIVNRLTVMKGAVHSGEYLRISPASGLPYWSPLSGLPRSGSQLGTHIVGPDLTLSPLDTETFDSFDWGIDPTFIDPIFSTVRVCARWPVGSWIDFVGPPYERASYAKAYIRSALIMPPPFPPAKDTWSGYLDANGCSPPLKLESSQEYVLGLSTELRAGGATVKVDDNDGVGARPTLRVVLFETGTIGLAPSTLELGEVGTPRHTTRGAAVASAVLRREGPRIPQQHYRVHANQRCPGSNAPACASAAGMYLGRNSGPGADGTHNSQWRYVAAHEFGHAVQGFANARTGGGYGSAIENADPGLCGCGHVEDETDQSHCLQSKEVIGAASREGFGHYFAARVFGGNFVYYKSVKDGFGTTHPPPYVVSAAAPVKWLENFCEQSGHGVEWDWLTFQYGLSVAPNPTRVDDLLDIYRRACDGDCAGSKQPDFFQLRNKASEKYGPQDARALEFEQRGLESGVNY